MSFDNCPKKMKASFVIFADFECLMRKIQGCEPSKDKSYTVKAEKHEPRGFAYAIVRSNGETLGLIYYRGPDAVYKFLADNLQKERWLRSLMADKKPLVMTPVDGRLTAIFVAKACSKKRSLILFLYMTTIQVNIAAKVTEDVTMEP